MDLYTVYACIFSMSKLDVNIVYYMFVTFEVDAVIRKTRRFLFVLLILMVCQ